MNRRTLPFLAAGLLLSLAFLGQDLAYATFDPGAASRRGTRTPRPTREPTATRPPRRDRRPTPTPTAKPPSLPPCAHSETEWHGIQGDGCRYDHSHNENPLVGPLSAQVRQVFGTRGLANPLGTKEAHAFYKWARFEGNCPQTERGFGSDGCLRRGLVLLHANGNGRGLQMRFHSMLGFVEYPNGGWGLFSGIADFGPLHCPYKQRHCPLPQDSLDPPIDPASVNLAQPPYRSMRVVSELDAIRRSGRNEFLWNSGSNAGVLRGDEYNQHFQVDFSEIDAWEVLDPNDFDGEFYATHFVCQDTEHCAFNHSTLRVYEVVAIVPADWDTDGDGYVTLNSFTDARGRLRTDCTQASVEADCWPLVLVNAPVGKWTFRIPIGFVPIEDFPDYDLSPPGEWWIQFPN